MHRYPRPVGIIFGALFFVSALATRAAAQDTRTGSVLGRVVAAENASPLAAASIVAKLEGGNDVVATAMVNAAGRFLLPGLRPGRYVIEVTHLGYAPATHAVTVQPGSATDLGEIRLSVQAIQLEGVTVETERPAAVFAADRDIYSAESLPMAAGGVATELMSGIPELEVDIDGTVMLRGSSPQIYINGRPAPMEGEALAAFLQQFPADRIERIEVIPNPSSRYDAEGAGGIINIVLKEGVDLGASGSLFANGDSRGSAGAGGRISWQRGRWTLHGNGFLRRNDQETTSFDLRENLLVTPSTFVQQESWSDRGGLSGSADMTAELRVGEKSVLRAQGRFADFGSDSDTRRTTTHLDADRQWTQRYERTSRTESTRRSTDLTLGFNHEFAERNHTLEAELRVKSGIDGSDERLETEFTVLGDDAAPLPADLTLRDAESRDREATLEIDYVRPMGEASQIEVGYRGNYRTREDDRLIEEFDDDITDAPIASTFRGFSHRQLFNSAYLTVLRRFGALGIQLGGRVQHADTRFEVPTGEAFETSDVDFFPSANLTYDLGGGKRLRLSYSRRSRRPSPWQLNPTDESTDPLNRRVGNPDLEPQYTHSIGMDASMSTSWGTLRFSPYVRRIENDWARIQRVDADGVSTTTWENVASQDILGASLTASVRRPNGWGGFVSLSARQERRDASNLATDISGNSFQWSVRGNLSGRLVSTLGMRATLSYVPARDVPQGRVSSSVDSSIGFRQQLLGNRASLNFTIRDPFDMSRTTFESRDPTFVQHARSRVSRRSASFGLSYTFGGLRNEQRPAGSPGGRGGPGRG
jgi:outer membrane receptor protein involved in Fe transport